MIYKQIGDFVHLLLEPTNRKQTVLEFIYTSGGSWFENTQDRGKKHLLEHCIVARTKKLDFKGFRDYQFAQNINVNAYTGSVIMGLDFHGHHSDATTMFGLMNEVAFSPTFDNDVLKQEKEIVLREISERRGEPSYKLHFDKMNQIFVQGSYETHEVLGDAEMVAASTISDFEKLMQQNLDNSHLIINMAGGGFDNHQIYTLTQQSLKNHNLVSNSRQAIDYQPKSQFQDFKFLPIVHQLAHEHAETSLYIPVKINFENKAIIKLFSDLFLKWHGVLYDNLRNKQGLIYSMNGEFKLNQQMLVIDFATEIKNVEKCLETIYELLSDFEKVFNLKKFEELKNVLTKKMEISSDNLTSSLYFSQNSLMYYGIFEDLEGFLKRLQLTSSEEIKTLYNQIKTGLVNKKVVVVSKDNLIEKLEVS